MVDTTQQPGIAGLLFPLFLSLGCGIVAYLLAKEKGRNVVLWTILGCIPFVNFLTMCFFIGASDLRLEKKLDDLIESQKQLKE